MKIYFNLQLLLLLTCEYLHSQSPEPLSFFPHHQGDVWEYVYPWGGGSEQNIILKDTLGPDGRYYLETTRLGKMCIDTATFEVRSNKWGGFTYNTLLFKLDSDSGDTWIADINEYWVLKAIVVDVYQMYFWGYLVTVKEIEYVDSATGLLYDTYYLASGFGIIRQDIDTFPVKYLRGAIINGIKYGTVDVNNDSDIGAPKQFVLYDNFPNPFNSSTIIKFSVKNKSNFELTIYDVLGQRIKYFIFDNYNPGKYEVVWNGTDDNGNKVSSGVYFYRLEADDFLVANKKMLLTK